MIHIAFIGFGEVGTAVSAGLREDASFTATAFDTAPDDMMRAACAASDVVLCDSVADALAPATLVFSAVTTENCVEAARGASASLGDQHIWFDWNSTSPMAKRAAAEVVTSTGARYTDTAVMSNIPVPRHRVPLLLAGDDAQDSMAKLNALNMNARVAGDQVGQAATIKMCRSVFLKGLDAVLFESLAAATKAGVRDQVIESIHETYPGLEMPSIVSDKLNRLAQHCHRRAGEMREVHATLDDLAMHPLTPLTTSGVLQRMSDSGCPEIADPDSGSLDALMQRYTRGLEST